MDHSRGIRPLPGGILEDRINVHLDIIALRDPIPRFMAPVVLINPTGVCKLDSADVMNRFALLRAAETSLLNRIP